MKKKSTDDESDDDVILLDDDSCGLSSPTMLFDSKTKSTPNEVLKNNPVIILSEMKNRTTHMNQSKTTPNVSIIEETKKLTTSARRPSRSFPMVSNNDEYNLSDSLSNEVTYKSQEQSDESDNMVVLTELKLIKATRSLTPLKSFASENERNLFIEKSISANNFQK
jgi:hypothetical protein